MSAVEEQSLTKLQPIQDAGIAGVITKAELDQAIMTAKAHPRSVTTFKRECFQLATMDEATADECVYAVPRDGKTIEGPSVRFAEIVLHSWRNCRGGARVIEEGQDFIMAQGVFMDLENNVSITREVRRRITKSNGQRYSADMISTTANAACSIALRNAVFNGVPKAFWAGIFEEARKVCMGDQKTLGTRRATILERLQKFGATKEMVFAKFGIKGIEDITLEHIATLQGIGNAIKENEITVEEAFAVPNTDAPPPPPTGTRTQQAKEALKKGQTATTTKQQSAPASSESETVPQYDVKSALQAINEAGDVASLQSVWKEINADYSATNRSIPLDIEAPYKTRLEALEQI